MSANKSRSSVGLTIVIILVVLVAAGFWALRALRPVARVEPVVSGDALDAKPASVTVKVEYDQPLQAPIEGRLISDGFNLEPGQAVTKGQVLAKLDPSDLELAIEQDQNDLKAAKDKVAVGSGIALELKGAEDELLVQKRLHDLGQISDLDYNKAERVVEATQQRLALEKVTNQQSIDTLEVKLKQEKLKLNKMTIVAPFDGIVSQVNAHPGKLVDNNFDIADLIAQHRNVEAQISEEDFANIRLGEPAAVIFLPYGDFVFNGKVSKILPTADPTTQRHLARIELTDIPQEKLVPGITGDATITVERHHADAVVPRRAIFGNNLYVVRNGVVELVKIKKGAIWLTGIEVLPVDKDGPPPLKAGDLVIVEELDKFREGDHVQTIEMPSDAEPKGR
jgi:RND family efflux transporter MFP subunit